MVLSVMGGSVIGDFYKTEAIEDKNIIIIQKDDFPCKRLSAYMA